MEIKKVLVIGGSGFIGSAIVAKLIGVGMRVTVPTRRRERARHLILHPTIDVIEADVHEPAALARLVAGQDAVINLVGVLHSKPGTPYGPDFARAHVELPKAIIAAMQTAGVKRLLYMSALGASANGPSMYARSRADGEAAVRGSSLDWTIFQPSVVFGPQDRFLNTFASLAKLAPFIPLAGAGAKLQPIYVEDVAQAFVNALTNPVTIRKSYELAGPHAYTLKELVQFASFAATGTARPVLPLPLAVGKLQAFFLELLPGTPLMSRDNVDSLKADNVASRAIAPELGITPTVMEPIATQYLQGRHPRSRFDARRTTRSGS
jgi:NADH dehydrogenase